MRGKRRRASHGGIYIVSRRHPRWCVGIPNVDRDPRLELEMKLDKLRRKKLAELADLSQLGGREATY